MSWTVYLHLRKNTRSGSAIQKELAAAFGKKYHPPMVQRLRMGIADHLLEVSVSLEWNQEGVTWASTLLTLNNAIERALNTAGVKVAAIEIDGHKPTAGYRVELTYQDRDHYVTYYTFETEMGKKKEREKKKLPPKPAAVYLTDIFSEEDKINW